MWAVRSKYKKGDFYDAVRFDPSRDNIISMRDDEKHNILRAKMAAGVRKLCTQPLSSSDTSPLIACCACCLVRREGERGPPARGRQGDYGLHRSDRAKLRI